MKYIISFTLLLLTPLTHAHPGHGLAPSHNLWHYLFDHYQFIVILAIAIICFSLRKKY